MIICPTRPSGHGDHDVAQRLVENYGFVRVGVADEPRRIAQRLYDFTDAQLWGVDGPFPDHRWIREQHGPWDAAARCACCYMHREDEHGTSPCYLTADFVVDRLLVEGRKVHWRTWSSPVLHVARYLAERAHACYAPGRGVCVRAFGADWESDWQRRIWEPTSTKVGVVVPDCDPSEVAYFRDAGAAVWTRSDGRLTTDKHIFDGDLDDCVSRALAVAQMGVAA